MITQGLMSSNTTEWETPQGFFDKLDAESHFGLDPCATAENAKCACCFTKAQDGLRLTWCGYGPVFVNPPYGRGIGEWIRKSYEVAQQGITVVVLIPARTDTRWWHEYVMKAHEIRFVKGRLSFTNAGDRPGRAPFPSAVVVFRSTPPTPQHGWPVHVSSMEK